MNVLLTSFLLVLAVVAEAVDLWGAERNALLIVAHGAPSPGWNQPVLELAEVVANDLETAAPGAFAAVRVAFLEFAKPSTAEVLEEMEEAGIRRVFVLPLFVAPSEHTQRDLPAILGLYSDADIISTLRAEGMVIARPGIPVTIGPTIDTRVIAAIVGDRISSRAKGDSTAAVVLTAHGSDGYRQVWEDLLHAVAQRVAAESGIAAVEYVFLEMGQGISALASRVAEAAREHQQVIVAGVYLVSDAKGIAERGCRRFDSLTAEPIRQALFDSAVVWESDGLLADRRTRDWLVSEAAAWFERESALKTQTRSSGQEDQGRE